MEKVVFKKIKEKESKGIINRVIIEIFKDIKHAIISFSQKNVIVGNNGVGKTENASHHRGGERFSTD